MVILYGNQFMKKYELFSVFPGTKTEEEALGLSERAKIVLSESGALNIEPQSLGKMKIAYPIKHIRYGYFYNFVFDAEPFVAQKAQGKLRLEADFLRAIIQDYNAETRKTKPRVAPVVPVTKKEETAVVIVPATVAEAPKVASPPKEEVKDIDIDKILNEEFIKNI